MTATLVVNATVFQKGAGITGIPLCTVPSWVDMCMYTTMLCRSAGLTGNRLCTMPSWMNMYMIPNSVMPSPAPKQTPPIREGVTNLNVNTTFEMLQVNTAAAMCVYPHIAVNQQLCRHEMLQVILLQSFLQAG